MDGLGEAADELIAAALRGAIGVLCARQREAQAAVLRGQLRELDGELQRVLAPRLGTRTTFASRRQLEHCAAIGVPADRLALLVGARAAEANDELASLGLKLSHGAAALYRNRATSTSRSSTA